MVSVIKAFVCYLSYGGNTKEVADLITSEMLSMGCSVDSHRIGSGSVPDLSGYDLILMGSFTWGKGQTPKDMKKFVAEVGYKPDNVYIFGTGDTQFGGDTIFCGATDRLCRFYDSKYPPLKIEQSPRGSQEILVKNWIKGVVINGKPKTAVTS